MQALKAAGAAVLAWALVGWTIRAPMALMAPWTALVLVDATVYRSVRAGLRQFAVIVLGAVTASFAMALTGGSTLGAMALALPVLVLAGTYRRLGREGIYGATTALLVITYGSDSLPALGYRLAETAVGAVIGIGVNAFVLPPVHLRDVRDQLMRVARDSGDLLAVIADGIREQGDAYDTEAARDRARRLESALGAVEDARQWTAESLRVNPGIRLRRPGAPPPSAEEDVHWHAVVGHLSAVVRILSHATGERSGLAVLPSGFLRRYGELAGRVSAVCAARAEALSGERGSAGPSVDDGAAHEAWSALSALAEDLPGQPGPTAAVCGGLLTETRQLLAAVCAGERCSVPASAEG
ncbi:FUSC family protein [Streptomyces fuscigenes]|uniref:FUSC family protein n=1 Tax=Streptomyces fuscigenes TaxID=1528880 RepID=UPI001F1F8C45|nr:aromatic acid exporter family protein [Streptomyces fuscigenes]MCF3962305.1 aromatic acid exporter family protein [Streptomyces fuscigenes]